MAESFAALIALAIPAFLAFVIIYYAVPLAIRHEKDRERRRGP